MASPLASSVRSRDPAGDALRAWAIVGVVAIHGLDLTLGPGTFKWVSSYFRWAVPAFIVLSAYYTALASGRQGATPLLPWLKARYLKLLPPFVFFSMFYLLVFADLPNLTVQKLLTTHLSGYGWTGQYFFIVLFQLLPMMWLLARRRVSGALALSSVALGLALYMWAPHGFAGSLLLRQLGVRPFLYWLAYCVWGVFLAQRQGCWLARVQALPAWLKAGLVSGLPLLMAMVPGPVGHDSPYVMPMVLLVSIFYVPLCLGCLKGGAGCVGAYLGQHSMAVFCMNPLFIGLCRAYWPMNGSWGGAAWAQSVYMQVVGSALLVLCVVAACLFAGNMLRRLGLGVVLP
jgi:peptidoglycan/LPS O-acetylase OafA/YrhL